MNAGGRSISRKSPRDAKDIRAGKAGGQGAKGGRAGVGFSCAFGNRGGARRRDESK